MVKLSFSYFSQMNGTRQAAALAFYTLFSLAPILLVAVALVGLFLQNRVEDVLNETMAQAGQFLGPRAIATIQKLLDKLSWERGTWWATSVGIILTLFGATTVFSNMKEALNDLWSVHRKPQSSSLKGFFRNRLFSLSVVLLLGILFIVLFFLSAMVSGFDDYISKRFQLPMPFLFVVNNLSIFCVMYLFLLTIFKLLPDVKQDWREVAWGALFTTALLLFGKYGISQYLGRSSLAGVYGAAGSLVMLLLWVYYSAAILFFGAAFVRALHTKRGKDLIPRRYAAKVSKKYE